MLGWIMMAMTLMMIRRSEKKEEEEEDDLEHDGDEEMEDAGMEEE